MEGEEPSEQDARPQMESGISPPIPHSRDLAAVEREVKSTRPTSSRSWTVLGDEELPVVPGAAPPVGRHSRGRRTMAEGILLGVHAWAVPLG